MDSKKLPLPIMTLIAPIVGTATRLEPWSTDSVVNALLADLKVNHAAEIDSLATQCADQHRALVAACLALILVALAAILLAAMTILNRRSHTEHATTDTDAEATQRGASMARTYIHSSDRAIAITDEFLRLLRRKICAGQSEDAFAMLRTSTLPDDLRRNFTDAFDEALLAAYPTFIERANSLFTPDSTITRPAPRRLTAELRILALMALGVTDGTTIGRLLGLSSNTVYSYRARLRSRALDRSTLDHSIATLLKEQLPA